MNKTIKTKLISLFAVLLSVCMLFSVASLVTSTAKAEGTTTVATLVEGAAVRVDSAESSGLKFKAQLDREQYNALYNQANQLGGTLKAGMIIVPTDYITAANGYTFNAFAAAGKNVASNTVEQLKDASATTYEFTMSIVKLYAANYDRDFEAIVYLESDVAIEGFVAYGEKYYAYAERNADYARNIYEVAKGVYNDRADVKDNVKYIYPVEDKFATLDADGLAIAKTFIDGVTEIVLDNGKPAAYSSEYYAAKDGILTNDTEAYLLGEHKNVVYKGESISSYPFTADGIAIKEMYTARATYANGEYTTAGYANSGSNYNQWGGVANGTGIYGYVAFDGAYGANTYVEVTFKGANMPNVMLFADDVTVGSMAMTNLATGNVPSANTNKGLIGINGMTQNGAASGAAPSSPQFAFQVYAPYRMHGHFPGNNPSAADRWPSSGPAIGRLINAGADVEYRAVIGTYIKYEDVHNASGAIYGAEEEKDGVLEAVLYYDLDLYNASTGALVKSYDYKLQPAKALNAVDSKYILASDMEAGGIMLFSALLGADETTGEVIDSTFKVTKAPYHVHNFNSEIKSDATHHWYECSICGEAGEKAEHLGGTATHTAKAECEVCGTAYGDLKPAWEVDDVKLVGMTNISATEVLSATKGTITFTATSAAPTNQDTATIGLLTATTTEYLKVDFTALADCVDRGTLGNAIGFWLGARRPSEASIAANPVIHLGVSIGPRSDTNDFSAYADKAANHIYPTKTVNAYWGSKITAGEACSLYMGVVDGGVRMVLIDSSNTICFDVIVTADQLSAKGVTLAESGFFSIHSIASVERTISYEIISAEQANYYISSGKGVEGLAVSGNTASWTAFSGATSYKVKVDNGEWTDVGNVTSYAIANLAALNTYNVSVKAVCTGYETKEATTSFQYVPADVAFTNVDMTTVKADGELSATKGKVTLTSTVETPGTQSASAITLKQNFTNQFVKVGFAAVGTYAANVTNLDAALGISIGFRRTDVAATNPLSDWVATPIWNTNFWSVYKGTGLGTAMVSGYGVQTPIANTAWTAVTADTNYSLMLGITGTSNDRTLHLIWLDENDNVLRYLSCPEAFFAHKYSDVEMADAGYFTIHSFASGERTISYEIIEATDVFKNANYGAIANVAANGATVSWDAVAGATNYLVSVNGGAYETVNTNSYTIANPVAFANYEVEIKANMGYYAATGSVNFVYTPAGVKLVNIDTIAANGAVSATSGSVTFADKGTGVQNSSTIAVKAENATDFLKVKFTALSTPVRGGLQAATALWFGLRRTEAQITINGNEANSWNAGPRTDTNDFCAYYGGNVSYFHVAGNTKEMPTWYWNGGITEGDTCYYLIGVTSEGEIKLVLVNETTNKLLCRGTVGADNATNLAADGYFTIHSFSGAERTLSWEIVSEASVADYLG